MPVKVLRDFDAFLMVVELGLAEMYLIINGMDDDLRQMMTIEKG